MSVVSIDKGLKFRYASSIAPVLTTEQYAELIKNYKATGQFPHILKLGGMAIDTSRNRNMWRVPLDDLKAMAEQLQGAPLMKDHDIDHVDSIIGKVEQAWVEQDKADPTVGKVMWAGETCDESLIQKILLGYVRFNSIQIAVPNAYCDNCMSANGKSEEQATIENLDVPCPRCGSLEMLIRHPMVLEQSMVAIPAYERAEVSPVGFKASLDRQLQKRFDRGIVMKKAQKQSPNPIPMLMAVHFAVNNILFEVAKIQLRMAKMELDREDKCRCDEFYPEQCPNCLAQSQSMGMADTRERDEEGDEVDQYSCSECGGSLMELGSLGSRTHYRCRNCGMEYSGASKTEEEPEVCKICGEKAVIDGRCVNCEKDDEAFKYDEAKGGSVKDFPLVEKKQKGESITDIGEGFAPKCPNCGSSRIFKDECMDCGWRRNA